MRAFLFFLTCLTIQTSQATEPGAEGALVDTSKIDDSKTSGQIDRENEAILQRHYPFYFAHGRPTSKLQLSFKSPILRTWPLYFGYTQFMFWALEEESKPFRDLTYNPELFYRWNLKETGMLKSIDISPWSHHSNGKRDLESRSFNRRYLRFNFEREGRRWMTRSSVQVSYLDDFDERNPDIQQYIGPLTYSLTFVQLYEAWVDKGELSLLVSPGGKFADRWDRGGYQISYAFRLGKIALVPSFYLQYYRGYAETLLNYDDKVSEFRAGFIF